MRPARTMSATLLAICAHEARIAGRYRARSSSSDATSGISAATFPQSSTDTPRASRRSDSPDSRIALGPMSTPRRAAPRSRGAPRMATLLGWSAPSSATDFLLSLLVLARLPQRIAGPARERLEAGFLLGLLSVL